MANKGSMPIPFTPDQAIDFVLITALKEERDAVLRKLNGYRQLPPAKDDIRTYFQADLPVIFPDNSTGVYRIIVMCLLGMGRVQAVTATADAIRQWHPRYILLIGIAGGMASRKIRIGDILISDQIVDYELQKIMSNKDSEIRWDVQRADPRLLDACNNFRNKNWGKLIQVDRPNPGQPICRIGPIASGDKVIAFDQILKRYSDTWPKLIGVEMEAGGAATAAFQSPDKPGFFMVRGVSDLADENKGSPDVEKWRSYASDVAASFAISLLKSGPVPLAEIYNQEKTRRVELILEGEFSSFTSSRREDTINVLAALLKIEPNNIKVLKVEQGSIVITLDIPDTAAHHLYEMATKQDPRMIQLGIKSVLVDGSDMVNLDDKTVKFPDNMPEQLPKMSNKQKISDWVEAVAHNKLTSLILNLLIGIGLFIFSHYFIQPEGVKLAFQYTITAIWALAIIQVWGLRYEVKRYITRDLIRELIISQGRIATHLQVQVIDRDNGAGIKILYPGSEYKLQFRLDGSLFTQGLEFGKIQPFLRISPPLFLGDDIEHKEEKHEISLWSGSVNSLKRDEDRKLWIMEGYVEFETSRINPNIEPAEEIKLALELHENNNIIFKFELGKIQVHQMTKKELFCDLIELGALKKLPPGYDILKISRDYYTNMVFLPSRLQERRQISEIEDKVDEIELTIANLVKEELHELQKKKADKRLWLKLYEPSSRDKDLNIPQFSNDIVSAANLITYTTHKQEQEVYFAPFQTLEFVSLLEKTLAYGICLFGFTQCIPPGVHLNVIFDLSKLIVTSNAADEDCPIEETDLLKMCNSSSEYMHIFAPNLEQSLMQTKRELKSSKQHGFDLSSYKSTPSLESMLINLQTLFDDSRRRGRFVISEPEITRVWVSLSKFANMLTVDNHQEELIGAIFYMLDRYIKNYKINPGNLSIVNLCSQYSGVANELDVLWSLDKISQNEFGIECCNVVIDQNSNEVTLTPENCKVANTGSFRDVVILVPIDSYVGAIEKVLRYVRERNNKVISIISLFSIASNWKFITTSDYFDVYPLFQVDPNPQNPSLPQSLRITKRADVQQLRAWVL